MNIFVKALLWCIGFELFLGLLVFGGHFGLPFLPYLALAFHFPALYLLDYWPAARATLVAPILIQWFIWFIAFVVFFAVIHKLQRKHSRHENDAA